MKKITNITIILMIMLLNCGAGYIDPPPMISGHSSGVQPPSDALKGSTQIDVPSSPTIIPIAPAVVPAIVKKGKYSEYLHDLTDIITLIEDMKIVLTTAEDKDIQMFCAKANLITLYVEAIKVKYGNKSERNYESYKQLCILSKSLNDTSNYWRYTYKYNKLLRGSVKDKQADEKIMRAKLVTALKSINTTLGIVKENSRNEI